MIFYCAHCRTRNPKVVTTSNPNASLIATSNPPQAMEVADLSCPSLPAKSDALSVLAAPTQKFSNADRLGVEALRQKEHG
jgi:hypothetical protein